jgi:hypothetical protein
VPTKVRHFRISDEDYETMKAAAAASAQQEGKEECGERVLSAWVRAVLVREARRVLRRKRAEALRPEGGRG